MGNPTTHTIERVDLINKRFGSKQTQRDVWSTCVCVRSREVEVRMKYLCTGSPLEKSNITLHSRTKKDTQQSSSEGEKKKETPKSSSHSPHSPPTRTTTGFSAQSHEKALCGKSKKGGQQHCKKTKEGERMEQFKVFITRSARKIVQKKKGRDKMYTPLFRFSPPI